MVTSWTEQNRTLQPIRLLIDSTYSLIIEPSTDHELLIEDFTAVTEWQLQTKN